MPVNVNGWRVRWKDVANHDSMPLTGSIALQIADDVGVDTGEILLPQLLQEAGYATAVIGKWHLGYNDKYHPNNRGLDNFFGFLAGGHDYLV